MAINITLPGINGEVELGLSVGVDPSLADGWKLPFLKGANYVDTRTNVAFWAYNKCMEGALTADATRIIVCGAVVCVDLGLCTRVGTAKDGDWIEVDTSAQQTQEAATAIMNMCTLPNMLAAGTVIIATKANWWGMNHHTGTGTAQGYVRKVLIQKITTNIDEAITTAAHTAGHWASTIKVLTVAGITGLRTVTALPYGPVASLTLSDDAKKRFSSMPAGTHRLAVSVAAASRLVRSEYLRICPSPTAFAGLPASQAAVMVRPSAYHIGAAYLTGAARADYNDSINESLMGRLGTYIVVMNGKSTLAKSPHFERSRVQSYDDYDPEFEFALQSIQNTSRMRQQQAIADASQVVSEAEIEAIRAGFRSA